MIEWVQIQNADAGVERQWQARVAGRSIAVLAESTCSYPRCGCVVHYRDGRACGAECESGHSWRGIIVGPDGVIADIELKRDRSRICPDEAMKEAALGLRKMGWEI